MWWLFKWRLWLCLAELLPRGLVYACALRVLRDSLPEGWNRWDVRNVSFPAALRYWRDKERIDVAELERFG